MGPKKNKSRQTPTSAPPAASAAVPTARQNSSESENSELEEHTHSRSSTSSVDAQDKENGVYIQNGNGSTFISRVKSIPLIHDSVGALHSYAKDNKYGRAALSFSESAVGAVNKYTEGYQKSFQPTFAKVDQLASNTLDVIEDKFPIVKKPTSEIVDQVKKPYSQIQTTIDTRVAAPVRSVTSSITSTAEKTRDQITTAATTTATTIATTVNTRAVPLVDGIETIINHVLPASADDEKTTTGQTNQATRVIDISRSLSLRVSHRVGHAVAPIKVAAENNAVVIKSKDQLQALDSLLRASIVSLRDHTKELSENVQKGSREATEHVRAHVHDFSTKVLTEFESLSKFLVDHSPALPDYVQARLQPLVAFVNERYNVVKGEMAKDDISALQKASNILKLTTEQTIPILHSAADEIFQSIAGYQSKAQDGVQKGLVKVKEFHSSVHREVFKAAHSMHVILVGK